MFRRCALPVLGCGLLAALPVFYLVAGSVLAAVLAMSSVAPGAVFFRLIRRPRL
jgi:hypothetical protein